VRELPGSPIANAALPQISYSSFDHTPAYPVEMDVHRGRLYLSDAESGTTLYSVLNRRASGWVQVDDPPDDLFLPRIGATRFRRPTSCRHSPRSARAGLAARR
jgi:hypothetical protein